MEGREGMGEEVDVGVYTDSDVDNEVSIRGH